jgi:hypothetical protein
MTAMMERFYGSRVDVRVLARRIDGTAYSRKIILVRRDTGAVVQFALAQFDLNAVSESVRREILDKQVDTSGNWFFVGFMIPFGH